MWLLLPMLLAVASEQATSDNSAASRRLILRNIQDIPDSFGDNLRELTITRSALYFQNDTTINATLLVRLDLSGNVAVVLEDSPFRTLRDLQVLNLSSSGLYSLHDSSFEGLAALKSLDLSGNNITSLGDVFRPLAGLQFLNLSGNLLRTLKQQCLASLQRLQHLDVSRNRLVSVELGTLQLPSLARILLQGNPELGSSLLMGTGQRLQTIDASRIGLKQVPAALTRSIRTLRLAGNSITSVRCGDFDSFPLLQLLDFTSNSLREIEDDALGRCELLSILYLSHNRLAEIPKSLSEKLKVLHLEHNRIGAISSRDFSGLAALEVLLLNDNNISRISADAFGPVTSLVTLDLSGNPIRTLPVGSFAGPSTLQVLRLAHIMAITTREDQEENGQHLESSEVVSSIKFGSGRLDAVTNEVSTNNTNTSAVPSTSTTSTEPSTTPSTIHNTAEATEPPEDPFPLSNVEHLVTLDLSGSPSLAKRLLTDTAALAATRELQELLLSSTEVQHIRSDLLHFLPQLRILRIDGNPLNCSGLQWLGAWMRRQNLPEYRSLVCTSPMELQGMTLIDLEDLDLPELPATTTVSSLVFIGETNVFTNFTLFELSTLTPNGVSSSSSSLPAVPPEVGVVQMFSTDSREGVSSSDSRVPKSREIYPVLLAMLGVVGVAAATLLVVLTRRWRGKMRRTGAAGDAEGDGAEMLSGGIPELW